MSDFSYFATRFVLVAACTLTLAGCETDGIGTTADIPHAGATGGTTDAETVHVARPGEPVQTAERMTHTRAARECWMRTEKSSARDNLDKRADLVNKCIEEKMKAAGPMPRT